MDAGTGLLLLANPQLTLSLFGASLPGGGELLMRYIGAFVLGVGLAYGWGLAARSPAARLHRLHGVWGATAIIRGCVALFVTSAVLAGHLGAAWLVVATSDVALAAIQVRGLAGGWFTR